MLRRLCTLLLVFALAPACSFDLYRRPPDARVPADGAGRRDGQGPTEQGPGDGPLPDGAPAPEQGPIPDGPAPDRALVPDKGLWPDLKLPPDQSVPPDSEPLPDTKLPPDQGPATPCAGGATASAPAAWTDMVLCMSPSYHSQQAAQSLCAAKWHMCTASEYLAKGGKTAALTTQGVLRWLAACIVPGLTPQNAVCAAPLTGCATACDVGWNCSSGAVGVTRNGSDRYPVVAHNYCYRLGQNSSTYAAYWWAVTPVASSSLPSGAVCCPN